MNLIKKIEKSLDPSFESDKDLPICSPIDFCKIRFEYKTYPKILFVITFLLYGDKITKALCKSMGMTQYIVYTIQGEGSQIVQIVSKGVNTKELQENMR